MTRASTADLIARAVADERAVVGFNVIGLEHAEGIVAGAERAGTGVLLQVSENAILFRGGPRPLLAACAEIADAAAVPVAIHLDHIVRPSLRDDLLGIAAEFDVGSIMIDASDLDFDDNVRETRTFAERARALGLWVEAELGAIGGKGGAHRPGVRTDPAEAQDFVARTGVDGLAVAVGSSHGMETGTIALDFDLLSRLAHDVPVPLVLHGSSGVETAGLRRAIASGIRKINIGTALNRAAFAGLSAGERPANRAGDPRPYLGMARDAIARSVEETCRSLDPTP